MVYFVRTKAGGIHPLHENELLTYLRWGHQIVYVAQSLPPQKDRNYEWVDCWVDPQAQLAVERILATHYGFDTWQLSIAELRVTWTRVQNEPKERITTSSITPGRIWVRVPANEVKQFITDHLYSAYFEGFRVERDAQGNVPVVSAPRMPREKKIGRVLLERDLVYVPARKLWGRVWNYVEADKHFVELGDLMCSTVPLDEKIRAQHRLGIFPVTSCVSVENPIAVNADVNAADNIAQKRGHAGGRRWSIGQVASM